MEKLLSVCIPSYNVENYLSRNLDSFIKSPYLDKLELIVVNDGSTDGTLKIASQYKELFPNSIIVIDKPNGHYGSCVNAALKIAQGKYFRIVDADDWVDSEALSVLLSTLPKISSDVIYTKYCNHYEDKRPSVIIDDPANMRWGETVNLNDLRFNKYVHMHQITYRTAFLRNIDYNQTEGICYTDTEYVFKPIVRATDIYCLDIVLYQYFIGRNDQSMSPQVLMKNFMHLHKVLISVMEYPKPIHTNINYEFLRNLYLNVLYGMLVDCIYANQCRNNDWNTLLRNTSKRLKSYSFDFSQYLNYSIRGCHWYKWWLDANAISNLKLKALFRLTNLKYRK